MSEQKFYRPLRPADCQPLPQRPQAETYSLYKVFAALALGCTMCVLLVLLAVNTLDTVRMLMREKVALERTVGTLQRDLEVAQCIAEDTHLAAYSYKIDYPMLLDMHKPAVAKQ